MADRMRTAVSEGASTNEAVNQIAKDAEADVLDDEELVEDDEAKGRDESPVLAEDDKCNSIDKCEGPIVKIWRAVLWDQGVNCCIVAAVFYSLTPVFVKFLDDTPVFQVALARSAFCLPWTVAVLAAQRNLVLWTRADNIPWLVARGISGAGAMVGLYSSVQISPLADTQTIFMMYPTLICLFAFLFLGERMTAWQVVGLVASMAGVVFVARPTALFGGGHDDSEAEKDGNQPLHMTSVGLVCVLVAAFLAAVSILIVRILSKRESAVVQTMWFQIVVTLICIPPVAVGWPKPIVTDYAQKGWVFLLCVGICSFVSQLLYNRAGQLLSAAMASCIISVQVPMAYAWGMMLFGEPPSLLSSLGTVLVITGLITVTLNKAPAKDQTPGHESMKPSPAPVAVFAGLVKTRSAQLLKRYTSSSLSGDLELITVVLPEDNGRNSSNKSGKTRSRDHASTDASEGEAAEDDADEGRGLLEGRD